MHNFASRSNAYLFSIFIIILSNMIELWLGQKFIESFLKSIKNSRPVIVGTIKCDIAKL